MAGRRRNSSPTRSVDRNGRSRARGGSRRLIFFFLRACSIALLAFCPSCAFFYRQPALPKHAAIEARETPQTDEKFAALVQDADVIYFPIELLGPASRTEPATKLVDALQRNGSAFAIGLDLIGGEEQALLDRWAKRELSTENLISQIHLSGTPRERENCRALFGQAKDWGVRFLALRSPTEVLGAAEEFAAERIVEHFRRHRDNKLLILIHRRHLGSDRGVPYFVAQKIKARQLVLDSHSHPSSSSQLLALGCRYDAWGRYYDRGGCDGWGWDGGRGSDGRLEIIDGAPGAGRDQL